MCRGADKMPTADKKARKATVKPRRFTNLVAKTGIRFCLALILVAATQGWLAGPPVSQTLSARAASVDGVDLARNRPTSDVSSTAAGSAPAQAVDGDDGSSWVSGGGGPQWLVDGRG